MTMGTSIGAPGVVRSKMALCPSPSGDSVIRKRTVPPTAISAVGGLKMFPGVNTSSVLGYCGPGCVESPPHAVVLKTATTTNRNLR